MVKRREPKASTLNLVTKLPTQEQIEAFASAAEGRGEKNQSTPIKEPGPNPSAIRDYKAMRVPFNQYEFEQLELASQLSGRSKLNFMRYAMLKLAKEIQEGEEKV
ncbi:MAG: hypothetical protein WCG16_11885 [Methylococcales bacterium]